MRISIIIPTLNEEKYVGALLQDLHTQAHLHEIIVVDGTSQDTTKAQVKKFPNVIFHQTRANVGSQRTYGGLIATGDILVFLDADTRVPRDFMMHLLHSFTKKNIDIAVPFYAPYKSTVQINAVYWFFNIIFFLTQKIVPSGAGSCIAVRKEIFHAHNGFNNELTYDDIEFIRRVAKKHTFRVVPKKIYVSDRRFRKYGVIRMIGMYMLLSIFFSFGLFKQANRIKYSFGMFTES
jgi:glycosyltransferase involved in cell wall biosynthesis